MSGQSAFEKRYVDPKEQSDVEGLLELFNLPPKVITFLRNNKRAIQIVLALVLIAIVSFSLYGSYKEKRIEKAASSLALALKETGSAMSEALTNVANDYDGTASAQWAKVELAHLDMKARKFENASQKYMAINKKLKIDNPLFALTLYGSAQAEEAQGNGDAAYTLFEQLKDVEGYQLTGYLGMARIHEANGDIEKALGIYGQYLSVIGDDPNSSGQKALVEAKITRLKARQ